MAKRILAIAGAVGHQLLAVHERRVEIGIVLAVLGDSAANFATEIDFGPAVRAICPAGFCRCPIDHLLQREVLAVTQPYAVGDQMASAAATLCHTLPSQWSWCHPSHPRGRWGMSIGLLR